MHILILGGTSEARQLAGRLAGRPDLKVTLSLAGRTAHPAAQPVPVRVGGFGGAEGLAEYLAAERIDVLIDATHPYADTMAAHAATAAAQASVPIVALKRPAWTRAGRRPVDRGRRYRRRGGGARRGAAPRVPRHRAKRGRRLRGGAAARLSDPQRRSGRAAAQAAARELSRWRAGRSAKTTSARCWSSTASSSSSPRTAAAKPPPARSRRRARLGHHRRHAEAARPARRADGRHRASRAGLARSCAGSVHRPRRIDQRRQPRPLDHAGRAPSRR